MIVTAEQTANTEPTRSLRRSLGRWCCCCYVYHPRQQRSLRKRMPRSNGGSFLPPIGVGGRDVQSCAQHPRSRGNGGPSRRRLSALSDSRSNCRSDSRDRARKASAAASGRSSAAGTASRQRQSRRQPRRGRVERQSRRQPRRGRVEPEGRCELGFDVNSSSYLPCGTFLFFLFFCFFVLQGRIGPSRGG